MTDRHPKRNRKVTASPSRHFLEAGRESGEVIVLSLATVLGTLWAIVLVTHFHDPLSSFGQSLWLMR
ncbi:hypothetical protein [Methylobacterium goesingense]|uniref:Uncharacterized protein n=1 Tax=Methylobacterium goesingense TaxID=243690 RepID=A0ABV2L8Z3_9HYPH|nr:hypothetical protein [Methylobacterium goesingense]GJD75712.1 hypothetical protein CFIICLFH_3955 [Methylobacterium goesingense]